MKKCHMIYILQWQSLFLMSAAFRVLHARTCLIIILLIHIVVPCCTCVNGFASLLNVCILCVLLYTSESSFYCIILYKGLCLKNFGLLVGGFGRELSVWTKQGVLVRFFAQLSTVVVPNDNCWCA